ncbi:MAG: flippase-like domain-containing protein [Solirubrobacterales bacterium]|nr:flippase-like domain-containing protein [Solirubrobacterales bacterium]
MNPVKPPSDQDLAAIEADPALRIIEEGLPAAAPQRSWLKRHSKSVSVGFALVVTAALILGLYDERSAFAEALDSASVGVLAIAAAMQLVWLVARSEAWHVCVDAAGAVCGRRPLYRSAAIGYLGNIFNPSFGLAVRIAELRRTAPDDAPSAGTLVAAEMPIVVIEIALAAICSFSLVGPLNVPWWAPLIALALGVGIVSGLSRLAHKKRHGFWKGLTVLRGLRHRNTIIGLTIFAVSAQVFRNWLVLRGVGVDVSVLDSIALLIATAALGLLPIGPSLGVATTVLILGSNGVAAAAAAGALLTATGAVGALVFAAWAIADRFRTRTRDRLAAGLRSPGG